MLSKDICRNVHSSIVHNSKNLETNNVFVSLRKLSEKNGAIVINGI